MDANVPINGGVGTNQSEIVVGAFTDAAYFFNRQPLAVDASEHAAWQTNEVVFRGEERFGFACIRPEAFEVVTQIVPST
jgi:HK97 family phage major capsid protein